MQKYLLIDDQSGDVDILFSVIANDISDARRFFLVEEGWLIGETISEVDFLTTGKNEADLNGLESQTFE